MKIAIFQMDTTWEAPQWNLDKAALWVEGTEPDVELCVLPEMFATGFSMNPERIAQPMDGEIVTKMTELAIRTGKALIFSAAIEDFDRHSGEHKFYNRLFFIAADGTRLVYNKRHLFRMAGEHNHYGEGENHMIIHYKGWKIATYICYDLRFPVWSRKSSECDMAIYIASWPEARSYAWSTLLRARAIENLCYTVGVNRTGDDPQNHYSGDSAVLDFLGMPLAEATPSLECGITVTLDLEKQKEFRAKFPAHLDADKFTLYPEQ